MVLKTLEQKPINKQETKNVTPDNISGTNNFTMSNYPSPLSSSLMVRPLKINKKVHCCYYVLVTSFTYNIS